MHDRKAAALACGQHQKHGFPMLTAIFHRTELLSNTEWKWVKQWVVCSIHGMGIIMICAHIVCRIRYVMWGISWRKVALWTAVVLIKAAIRESGYFICYWDVVQDARSPCSVAVCIHVDAATDSIPGWSQRWQQVSKVWHDPLCPCHLVLKLTNNHLLIINVVEAYIPRLK